MGGYLEYRGGVQYRGGYHDKVGDILNRGGVHTVGGYHEFIMSTVEGVRLWGKKSIVI